jgi:hypothetical protein
MNSPSGISCTHQRAVRAERRDEGAQHDQAGVRHQPPDLADAADVLHPVLGAEAEVAAQAVPHIVAVQQVGVHAQRGQALLDQAGDGGLARAAQAGEPQQAGALALVLRAAGPVYLHLLPDDVCCS